MTRVAELVRSSYLGFPLEITDAEIVVRDRHGRKLVTVQTLSAARRFCRGYRRIPSNVEPTATHARATAGSDSEGA